MPTVNELIEWAEDLAENGFGETEVKLATQPSWPFENELVLPEPALDDIELADAVYLAEGAQVGYLSREAKELVGWSE